MLVRGARVLVAALATVLAAGCASDRPAARAPQAPAGVLMSEDSTALLAGMTADEALSGLEKKWELFPADVKVVERGPRSMTMTLDMAKVSMTRMPDPKAAAEHPMPVRLEYRVETRGGTDYLDTRQYYLGSDAKVLESIESSRRSKPAKAAG